VLDDVQVPDLMLTPLPVLQAAIHQVQEVQGRHVSQVHARNGKTIALVTVIRLQDDRLAGVASQQDDISSADHHHHHLITSLSHSLTLSLT
jgi:hypothetical protein